MYTENQEVFDVTAGVVTIGSSTDQIEINGTSGITIRENDIDTILSPLDSIKYYNYFRNKIF